LLDVEVLIVGAGFAGMCAAIKLREAGIHDFVVLERDADLGGTWYVNSYPGCACDIQTHLYSYSFAPNPDWSHMFGRRDEIWDYQRRCADRYQLRANIRFSTEVTRAAYDETDGTWRVETGAGAEYRARFLIAGMGGLSRPALPDIPGLDRYQGRIFHSARWDHSFPLEGKRVAVIGTGASAIQIVPSIADEVDHLYLFQRTAPWVLPRPDRKISRFEKQLFRRLPIVQRLYRTLLYWRLESRALVFTVWPRLGGFVEWLGRYNIRRAVSDPALRRRLTPDFPAGCKRVLLSNDYYPSLTKPNVDLVTTGIREITASGVVCADGSEYPADAIVLGTGFQATTPIPEGVILGRKGLDLTERWRDGAEAYLGMYVSGFPNLFLLMGPNTGTGHNSVIFLIEAQMRLLMDCLRTVRRAGPVSVEVSRDVEAAYNDALQRRLARTVWSSGCNSWYQDANGRITTLWPGFTVEFWWRTRRFEAAAYKILPAAAG
jgi:cation diffusion facilitator CzcD-associated flavoprotein CzcO